jgi:hypothetical protein
LHGVRSKPKATSISHRWTGGDTDLLPVPRRVERQFSREVNVTRFSENEFREKLYHEDHFLKSVIKDRLIRIMGSLNEVGNAAGRK